MYIGCMLVYMKSASRCMRLLCKFACICYGCSPLYGSKVVLRQLAGPRAQRWRKHALQVRLYQDGLILMNHSWGSLCPEVS